MFAWMVTVALLAILVLLGEGRILRMDNFNGAYTSYPSRLEQPKTTEEMRRVVMGAKQESKRVRVVSSTTHSWGGLAMSDDEQVVIDTEFFNRVLDIDTEAKTVTVQAGILVHDLLEALQTKGLTLKNLGAIDVQSVGGGMATSTHGSNTAYGGPASFSDNVLSLRLMDHNGEVHHLDRNHEHFNAARTSLGMLGVVLDVTLSVREFFHLQKQTAEVTWEDLTVDKVRRTLERQGVHSVEYFLTPQSDGFLGCVGYYVEVEPIEPVQPHNNTRDAYASRSVQTTLYEAVMDPPSIPSVAAMLAEGFCGDQGWTGESYDVLARQSKGKVSFDHFFMDTEYAFPLEKLPQALRAAVPRQQAMKDMVTWIYLRFQPATDSLMALNQGKEGTVVAYLDIGYGNHIADHPNRAVIESAMLAIGARPHWGKRNELTSEAVRAIYPDRSVEGFLAAKRDFDPQNMFGNAYTDKAFGL